MTNKQFNRSINNNIWDVFGQLVGRLRRYDDNVLPRRIAWYVVHPMRIASGRAWPLSAKDRTTAKRERILWDTRKCTDGTSPAHILRSSAARRVRGRRELCRRRTRLSAGCAGAPADS